MSKWYSRKDDTYGEYVLAVLLAVFIVALVVVLIVGYPLVMIWALNTLFPLLAIPFTFWTWLAMFFVNLHIGGLLKNFKKKD